MSDPLPILRSHRILTSQLNPADIAVTWALTLNGATSEAYMNGIRKSPMGNAANARK